MSEVGVRFSKEYVRDHLAQVQDKHLPDEVFSDMAATMARHLIAALVLDGGAVGDIELTARIKESR